MSKFTRINSDINGNPRYVIHFLDMIPDLSDSGLSVSQKYNIAVNRAHKIGGRKYNTKRYGGGIVFQSYSLEETERDILSVIPKS